MSIYILKWKIWYVFGNEFFINLIIISHKSKIIVNFINCNFNKNQLVNNIFKVKNIRVFFNVLKD